MSKPRIRPYTSPAGGWGTLDATSKALLEQNIAISGYVTLLRMNQPEGFDCPGCAWPDPKHTSSFEFCENGAKAVAWEATAKRCTPEFFAAHTVTELESWSEPQSCSVYSIECMRKLLRRFKWETDRDD